MATAQQNFDGNIGDFQVFNFKVVEKFPPNSPFSKLMKTTGTQNTPSLARGNLKGSAIQLLNGNLAHACDFKFIFNVNINLFQGIDPVGAIQKALKGAKNKAAIRLRNLVKEAAQNFRTAIDAILSLMGFDPSGQVSFQFSLGKDILRKVQDAIEWVAEKVAAVMEWVYFAQQIQQLINWVTSLPERIKNLLLGCLQNFTKSLQNVANNINSLPDQITKLTRAQITAVANQFSAAALTVASESQKALNTTNSNLPASVAAAIFDPTVAQDGLKKSFSDTTAEANTATEGVNTLSGGNLLHP